jgi:hypothetical protein
MMLLAQTRREGYQAYLDGLKLIDNPYSDTDSDQEFELYCAWNEGYANAGWDD